MEYKKIGQTYYARLDRGDELITSVRSLCKAEGIRSATFSGIGGCSHAELLTFAPELGAFEVEELNGTLELVSLTGNVITDADGELYHHVHAVMAYKDERGHRVSAGHVQAIVVRYSVSVEIRPVIGGVIMRHYDEETGTNFWSFPD